MQHGFIGRGDAGLVAELNDLLQLDHDAVQAYSLAIASLFDPGLRETLIRFRGDHERHVHELTLLIREFGGTPIPLPHIPTGAFKLAMQAAGIAGGDRGIMLAFRANEAQVREKYRRHADRPHPPHVADVLRRAAQDEERHFAWASEVLEQRGVGPGTPLGAAAAAFGSIYGTTADALEAAGRIGMQMVGRAWRGGR